MRALFFILSMVALAHGFKNLMQKSRSGTISSRLFSAVGDVVPSNVLCDVVEPDEGCDSNGCKVSEAQDFGELLKTHKKAILFGVPGAFTPTCR
jgi:hypothetical protein